MLRRQIFTFHDLEQECHIEINTHMLDGKPLGAKVYVPDELHTSHPFNSNAYDFMQFLRTQIFQYGLIEFPNLPPNKTNYTLAQKAPRQHADNPNPYMRHICQQPHQDTPPYPTAFWLPERRRYFATWVISQQGLNKYQQACQKTDDIIKLHKALVDDSLDQGYGLLLNQQAGLLLIDNSEAHQLYHARTCCFNEVENNPNYESDTPMYAFNEVGLLNYLNTLDIYRGKNDLDEALTKVVKAFMQQEAL